jgi:hypothetical protein
MKNNRYISRYNAGDNYFNRTDPWKHLPWDFEQRKSVVSNFVWEALAVVLLIGSIALMMFLAVE